jgi:hypothetical protein
VLSSVAEIFRHSLKETRWSVCLRATSLVNVNCAPLHTEMQQPKGKLPQPCQRSWSHDSLSPQSGVQEICVKSVMIC